MLDRARVRAESVGHGCQTGLPNRRAIHPALSRGHEFRESSLPMLTTSDIGFLCSLDAFPDVDGQLLITLAGETRTH
jgi:hypothetical protein